MPNKLKFSVESLEKRSRELSKISKSGRVESCLRSAVEGFQLLSFKYKPKNFSGFFSFKLFEDLLKCKQNLDVKVFCEEGVKFNLSLSVERSTLSPLYTITKEKIDNQVPFIEAPTQIILASNLEECRVAVESLTASLKTIQSEQNGKIEYVGLDLEWRVCVNKNEVPLLTLLQISTEKCTALFRLNMLPSFPESLGSFLGNEGLCFVGLAVHNDVQKLKEQYGVNCKTESIENLELYDRVKPKALRALSAIFLNMRLIENAKTSAWDSPKLTKEQISYAALDAYCSLMVFLKMKEKNYKHGF